MTDLAQQRSLSMVLPNRRINADRYAAGYAELYATNL